MTEKEYALVAQYDPWLKHVAEPFDFSNPTVDPQHAIEVMKQIMIKHKGLGLSANQVGLDIRMFIFGDYNTPETLTPVFNPVILWESEETEIREEGCLSFPALYIKVKRPVAIRARFLDSEGKVQTIAVGGMTARLFQHETDHLNGKTFKDRATVYHIEQGERRQKKTLRRLKGLQYGSPKS